MTTHAGELNVLCELSELHWPKVLLRLPYTKRSGIMIMPVLFVSEGAT